MPIHARGSFRDLGDNSEQRCTFGLAGLSTWFILLGFRLSVQLLPGSVLYVISLTASVTSSLPLSYVFFRAILSSFSVRPGRLYGGSTIP